jgi:copper chaperone CopZ
MHCGASVRRVAQPLERTPGTEVVEVRVGAARIQADDPGPAIASIAKAGYTARAED